MNNLNHQRYFGRDITNLITRKSLDPKYIKSRPSITPSPHNQQYVPPYLNIIFKYILNYQSHHPLSPNLPFSERCKAIETIIENHHQFKLSPHTLFIAINIINKLFNQPFNINKQLIRSLAITSLFIAAKYQQTYRIIKIKDLISQTNIIINSQQIKQYESTIMQLISFNITNHSSYLFLEAIAKIQSMPIKSMHLAQYFIQLSLFDQRMYSYPQSLVGCSAFYLVNKIKRNQKLWSQQLKQLTSYDQTHVEKCAKALLISYQDSLLSPFISVVRSKFSSLNYSQVTLDKFTHKNLFD